MSELLIFTLPVASGSIVIYGLGMEPSLFVKFL